MNYSKRFAAAVVAVFFIILIWLSGFYNPKNNELINLESRYKELQIQLINLENMSMSIEEFENSVDSLNTIFEREIAMLPIKNKLNDRITRISNLAGRNRVSVNIINPSSNNMISVTENAQLKALGIIVEKNAVMMQFTGKYLDLGRFLERINELGGVYIERVEILSDPMVYPELNVFAYLFMYSRAGAGS